MAYSRVLVLNPQDSVATALTDLAEGQALTIRVGAEDCRITLRAPIAFGHKVALMAIPAGGSVLKYGEVIGRATQAIAPGDHVHVHNLESVRGRGDAR